MLDMEEQAGELKQQSRIQSSEDQIYTCCTLFHQYFKCRNNVTINAFLVVIKALLINHFKDQLYK